jgi:two-component system, OmpR family, response regulator
MEKVIIIDDEIDICFLLSNILKKRGFAPLCAHNLKKGCSLVEDIQPSVLFLDINLPDGNGLDVISLLRTKVEGLKIIVISAYDSERFNAFKKGADAFISKPFNKEEIQNVLNEFVLEQNFKPKTV